MSVVFWIRFLVITDIFVKSLELPELGDINLLINKNELGYIPTLGIINISTYTIQDQFLCFEFCILIISIFIGIYNMFNTLEQNDINFVISYCISSIFNTVLYQLFYLLILWPILLFYNYSIILVNWIEPNLTSDLTLKSNIFTILPYLIIGYIVNKFYLDIRYVINDLRTNYNISIYPILWGLCSIGFITYYLHFETDESSIDINEYLIKYVFIIFVSIQLIKYICNYLITYIRNCL